MKYEATPRPEIEYHPHIKELIERQEKRHEDRVMHRERLKDKEERDDLIKDSKAVTLTDFYCTECQKDFRSVAIRQIEIDWTNTEQNIAFYKTKCFRGHWCIRLITDKHKDNFWTKSRRMALDRGNHSADTVQPWETNFNLLYGKK